MEANERISRRATPSGSSESPVVHGDWKRLNEIGKGSFALVYRGVHKTKGSLVAIKSVNMAKLTSKLKQNLNEEINILRKLHHPHIVALFDCIETKTQVHIVMEFCELGDLSNFIRKRSSLVDHDMTRDMMLKYPNPSYGGLNEVICRHFLKQISSAIEYLHARNTLHRDIKPQNLLLVPSAAWYEKHRTGRPLFQDAQIDVPPTGIASLPQLKIADFGFARFLPSLSLAETLCGSPLYMAPEILRYEKYDNKADLWSVGTVLHEMVVGKPPFRAQNHVDLLRKIEKSEDNIRFPEGNTISREMKTAIRALLKKSPIDRISYENFFALDVIVRDIPGLVGEDLPKSKAIIPIQSESEDTIARDLALAQNSSPIDPVVEQPVNTSTPSSRRLSTPPVKQSSEPQNRSPVQSPPSSPRIRDRRPSLTHHVTAPAPRIADRRQSLTGDRSFQDQPRSMLKAHLDQKRGVPSEDKALREIREQAAQDVAFERDYVLVEKRSVEVNAFADEMSNSPLVQQGSPHHPGALIRRATTAGVPLSTTAPVSSGAGARAMQMLGRRESLHSRNTSYDKKYGRSPVSGAITKALNMANQRLFGIGMSPPLPSGPSPPRAYSPFPIYPTAAQSSMLMIGDGGKTIDPRDDDMRVAILLEDLATRSDVVWGFAEVKYQQLLPTRPQSPRPGFSMRPRKTAEEAIIDEDDEGLTIDAIITIAEEALVLYVKALAILARVIDVAGSWWGQKHRGEVISVSPRSAPVPGSGGPAAAAATKINSIVQWARNRFNDCLEKSEFVGRKLQEAQRQLPSDHPAHPTNHPAISSSSSAGIGIGTSAENFQLTTGVTAEGLMYDRALEMSRTAAVQEAMGRELESSEVSYRTAICMLEAILDNDEDRTGRQSSILRKEAKEDEEGTIDGLETEDRAAIKSLLDGLKKRLRILKRKIDEQKKHLHNQFEEERQRKKSTEDTKSGSRRRSIVAPPLMHKPASSPSRLSPANMAPPQLSVTPPL